MDPNLIIAIISVSAIFSPTIVAIIDNIVKCKIRKMELNYPNQKNALTNFVNQAMSNFNIDKTHTNRAYISARNDLYIYFKNVPQQYIDNLKTFQNNDFSKYVDTINLIVKELAQQISK